MRRDNATILHYFSAKCKRVTSRLLAAEIHALDMCFEHPVVVPELVSEMLDGDVSREAYVHLMTFLDVISKTGEDEGAEGPILHKRISRELRLRRA